MAEDFKATRARKNRVRLKINVQGPSGSGKTKGALAVARGIAEQMAAARGASPEDAKVCVIDTEQDSSLLYADEYVFDHVPLDAPYTTDRYRKCIQAQVDAGYDVLVVDSLTHWWRGDGGVLQRKDKYDREHPGSNTWANWGRFDDEVTGMIEFIKNLPIHVIYAARSKQKIVLQDVGERKNVPTKIGMEPQMKDDMDYEFDLVFEIDKHHAATSSKDRTTLFSDRAVNLLDPEVASQIYQWATSGVDAKVRVVTQEERLRIFGAARAHGVSPEEVAAHIKNAYNVTESTKIPASAAAAIIRWIEFAKQTTNEENIARQTMEALKMSTEDRARLIQKHSRDWDAINGELEILVSNQASHRKPEEESQLPQGEFYEEDGTVQCVVLNALRKEGAGNREYMEITMNGHVGKFSRALCWHKSLMPCLSDSKGQVVIMKVTANEKGVSIEDVSRVGDRFFEKGKLVQEKPAAAEEFSQSANPDAE